MEPRSKIRLAMLKLADRPEGAKAADCSLGKLETVSTEASRMVKRGELIKIRVSHKDVRYFVKPKDAEQFASKLAAATPAVTTRIGPLHTRAAWSVDEPGIITEKTKFTVCPSPQSTRLWTNTHSQS